MLWPHGGAPRRPRRRQRAGSVPRHGNRVDRPLDDKRVERIWRQESLKVSQKQPKRARLWWADDSYIRHRSEYPNHVWSYDFIKERTPDGRPLKMLTMVDQYTRECLAIAMRRRLTSREVQEVLNAWFLIRGCPTHIRSDNSQEFIATALRAWYRVWLWCPYSSGGAVRGKMSMSNPLTGRYEMNC